MQLFDRLEAEGSHANEGLEEERIAEASHREPKAKLGQELSHLELTSAHASMLLWVQLVLWRGMVETLHISNLEEGRGVGGEEKAGRRKKKTRNKMSTGVSWASFNWSCLKP